MKKEDLHKSEEQGTEPPWGGSREKKRGRTHRRYSPEFRLKAVKLHLKSRHSYPLLCRELGINQSSLFAWVRQFKQGGKDLLQDRPNSQRGVKKLPAPITAKIIALKQQHPTFGITSISQLLRRGFQLPAPKKKTKNLTRPRFFDRATPNQMWQSDIFTFRLGGRYPYLIAFLDEHSRYVMGADMFRSPTAEAVIEVYRTAIAEFKPPREMLTDNGHQYTS